MIKRYFLFLFPGLVLMFPLRSLSQMACPVTNPVIVNTTSMTAGQNLRWAITCVNNVTTLRDIRFNIAGAGPHILRPSDNLPLPTITKSNATIVAGQNIVIDGSAQVQVSRGIEISANNVLIEGLTLRNFQVGQAIDINSGTGQIIRNNTIFFSAIGINVGRAAGNVQILGNSIGVEQGLARGIANVGIEIQPPVTSVTAVLVQDNTIAHSESVGIAANHTRPVHITMNRIFCNAKAGITRNATPATPVITAVDGAFVRGTASPNARIELFSSSSAGCPNAPCQGRTFVGNVNANAVGAWQFPNPGLSTGTLLTCTQTTGGNNTSEFSACFLVPFSCAAFALNANVNDARCFGESSGSISLNVQGASAAPVQISWSTGQSGSSISNLPAGNYGVTVRDGNNCTITELLSVSQPSALTLSLGTSNPTCAGLNDGLISTLTGGGQPPYTFAWSNGATTSSLQQIGAGTYSVTMTDRSGCTAVRSATLTAPTAVTVQLAATPESQPGRRDGTVSARPGGGTPPYLFRWNTGGTGASLSGLSAGNYSVTVTDSLGCVASGQVVVPSAACQGFALSAAALSGSCSGGFTGRAEAEVRGGQGGSAQFFWSNGSTGPKVEQLAPGTYQVTAVDALGCQATASVTVQASGRIPRPVYGLTAPDSVCGNAPIALRAEDLFPSPNVRYRWQFPDGTERLTAERTLTIPAASLRDAGEYAVARDSGGCTSVFFGPVLVDVLSVSGVSAGPDTVLCQDARVALRATQPALGEGRWRALRSGTIENPRSAQTTVTGLMPGTNLFVWTVGLPQCPEAATDTARIVLERRPVLGDDFYQIERIQEVAAMNVLLNDDLSGVADTVIAGFTQPAVGVLTFLEPQRSFLYVAEPEFRGIVTFSYSVCNPNAVCFTPCDTAQVTIEVFNLPDPAEGMILEDPGPNGSWIIKGLDGFTRVAVSVFNRWGDQVYRSDDYRNESAWQGRLRNTGAFVPPGTYYYSLQAFEGKEQIGKTQKGPLYILTRKEN